MRAATSMGNEAPSADGADVARWLAWAAIAGQVLFIASWVIAGALDDGYSHIDQGVSELGADDAENPLLANAGIVVLGLSLVALALALRPVLPRRPAREVTAALFAGAGIAVALGGLLTLDCGMAVNQSCEDAWRAGLLSWQHDAHLWVGLVAEVLFVLTPFALARALWPSPAGAAALAAGAFGGAFFAAFFALAFGTEDGGGLLQRIALAVMLVWVVIVACGVLWETRRPQPRGGLSPVTPRDFFAGVWTGEGELVIWPYFIGRRLARRFEARREATWLSDRIWRFDDSAHYPDGRVQTRRTYCEFVSDDHVRLTAGDLPDGADVYFEEGGYRLTPWRMMWPLGPIPIPIRCRDISERAPDGTFVNVIEARTLVFGIPLAQTRFYVRPTDGADAGRASGPARAQTARG